jgi:hypothetical protein
MAASINDDDFGGETHSTNLPRGTHTIHGSVSQARVSKLMPSSIM